MMNLKSSLLNALIEQNVMKVQPIREVDSRWRHTTTQRQLFLYVQNKTSYLFDKDSRNKTASMWSKQSRKNGGLKI